MTDFNHEQIFKDIKADCSLNITLNKDAAKRFFKTKEGSYGSHDRFLGITVPNLRKIAKKYHYADLIIVQKLLQSKYNEERLLALLILLQQFQKEKPHSQTEIYHFYLKNLEYINNWNLVDSSAHLILGHYLWDKDKSLLNELAKSKILWERRIAIVATWYFIRQGALSKTFEIAILLLSDKEDLIHKAVGWMLREAGKKDINELIEFICKHASKMPKTMRRYAIEKFSEEQRRYVSQFI